MTPKPDKIITILSRAIYPILAKNTYDTRTLKIWVVGNSLNYFLLKLGFATLKTRQRLVADLQNFLRPAYKA